MRDQPIPMPCHLTTTSPRRAALKISAAGCLAAAFLAGGLGCTWDLPRGTKSILVFNTEPTPTEAANWAIDKYDADKRYRGTLLLANAPYGNDPVYMQLFLDNIKDPDPGVRSAATRAIGRHGEPDQVPMIIERLSDEDRFVRAEAARSLQRLHNPAAIDPLIATLRPTDDGEDFGEKDPEVRAEAASALGQFPENKVIESLITALADPSLSVNRNAKASLQTLTGQDFGFDRRAWIDWYDQSKATFAGQSEYTYPIFNRRQRWWEYLPFVATPNNEPPSTPIGMPRAGQAPAGG
jgi:hypothetical protein